MDKKYYVIVPSLGDEIKLFRLLFSFSIQKIKPRKIILLLDKKINGNIKKEYLYFLQSKFNKLDIALISNVDYDFEPGKGVSYVRNYGLNISMKYCDNDDFLLFVDDDISFSHDLIEKVIEKYKSGNNNFLIFPKVYLKHTNILQTAGIKKIFPWTGKIKFIKPMGNSWQIDMTSLQFLFGPARIFYKFSFDIRMKFVYEDLDYTATVTEYGYKILGFDNLKIHHFENKKNKSEQSYVSTPFLAYEKGKNRILFVKKHFNLKDKLIYFSIGIWIHSLYLILLMLIYNKEKLKSIVNFVKGTFDGLRR